MAFTFLTAEWRKLIMAQYEVAPEVLVPHVPPGLELDLYRDADGQQRCYVSLVGFLFDRVRLLGVPVPFHTRFEEVNLRFYVRRPMPDTSPAGGHVIEHGYRRGVVFLSEIVPKPAITLIARGLYGEAYSTAATSHEWQIVPAAQMLQVGYAWEHRGEWQSMRVDASAAAQTIAAGSLEEFITEHYWGYTRRRGGGTAEYGVEHPQWASYGVRAAEIRCDFGALYGEAFAELTSREPDHVLLAEGSPIKIRWGRTLP
jgi:uncharacterized protein YqjF (DUF2071 family)